MSETFVIKQKFKIFSFKQILDIFLNRIVKIRAMKYSRNYYLKIKGHILWTTIDAFYQKL